MDSIQGMRLIQILFFLSSLFSVWPQALFTEWHPSLAWNKMGFCFWIFCGTHQYSIWISQQSWWINPHNVPSDVWNDFNSSLMKIMREMMWHFCGHTGSLYKRQEGNSDLFILRGAEHLLDSLYRRSTLRIHALPSDLQLICTINLPSWGGIPWTGTSFLPHHLSNPVN